jgi:uncharacterized protein (UPF0332 family)
MREDIGKFLEKASRAIRAADTLLREGDVDFAAARAYYAMFYVARALLEEQGLRPRKHGGVHAAFGERFARTNVLDPKFHRWLLDAFDRRTQADYGVEAIVTSEEVTRMIEQAREFLRQANQHLGMRP